MLSRTADSLYWLGRYMERAGNTARALQVALREAGMGGGRPAQGQGWRPLLLTSGDIGLLQGFGAAPDAAQIIQHLVMDRANDSSIQSCIEASRQNARQVRTALTVDMWESVNDTWGQMRRMENAMPSADDLPGFLDWVKRQTILFNGAYDGTMLRDEAWRFVRLGTMLERADNTARVLHAHAAALSIMGPGTAEDYLNWQAILRNFTALRAYQWVYHGRIEPRRIAELLILRGELPRSMIACHARIEGVLDEIATAHGGRRGECHRRAGEMHARLRFGRVEDIFADGLEGFLNEMMARNIDLGGQIAEFYLHN